MSWLRVSAVALIAILGGFAGAAIFYAASPNPGPTRASVRPADDTGRDKALQELQRAVVSDRGVAVGLPPGLAYAWMSPHTVRVQG
jgi:hypothetical protein